MRSKRALLVSLPLVLVGLLGVALYFGASTAWDAWTSPEPPLPAITVEAMYPGASAQVVADVVAAPIEAQVNGVEQVASMHSRCGNDGSYQLTVTFHRGTDLDMAQVLVQNRVSLALPLIANEVQNQGILVKKKSPGIVMIVNVSSPDASHDALYLSNYATINVKDELGRLIGVNNVAVLGEGEQRTRVEFDSDRLTAADVTIQEALDAIRQHRPAGGLHGGPVLVQMDVERGKDTILKVGADKRIIHLKDVARVTNALKQHSTADFNGKPTASLLIYLLPQANPQESAREVANAVKRLRDRLPAGVSLDIDFEFTTNHRARPRFDDLWLDVNLPAGASRERTIEQMHAIQQILKTMKPVEDVLALSGAPIAGDEEHGCLLVRLEEGSRSASERAEIVQAIRARLEKDVPAAAIRLRDLTGTRRLPPGEYPVRLGVTGPTPANVRDFATTLADRMRAHASFTDVHASADAALVAPPSIEILREPAAIHGIMVGDLMATIAVCLEASPSVEFAHIDFGLQRGQDMQRVMMRSAGKLIPLEKLVKVQQLPSPRLIHRFNRKPMEEITANPAPGISHAAARLTCETLAEEVRQQLKLSADFRVVWP